MPWQTLTLELVISCWIIVLLIGELFAGAKRTHELWKLALAGLAVGAGALWWERPWIGSSFDAMFRLDAFAWSFKWLFLLTAAIVVLMTRAYSRKLAGHVGEWYALLFSALLGTLVLASVQDFLLLFIGLELLTFSLYVMAAYLKTDTRSTEAGLKYLIIGSVSSGFLVYGISLLYGACGGVSFVAVRNMLSLPIAPMMPLAPPTALAGMFLVLAGLGFKVAAVPFHLWVPDVYEGSPTPVAAFLSVGSKMAGVVALLRVLFEAFLPAQAVWGSVLAVLSALTMLYGNLAAMPQTNIKRLLGYSSIGHAGYLLMGLSTALITGAQGVGFYLVAYLVSNLAVFFVVVLVGIATDSDSLEAYDGLAKRSPLLAAVMFVGLLSLAGVPPLAGFSGKLLVLMAAVDKRLIWLAGIGAVNVAISLYYYLRVVHRMYVLPPSGRSAIAVDRVSAAALIALLLAILFVGTVQDPVLAWIRQAITF